MIQTVAVEKVDGLCVKEGPLYPLADHFQIERITRQYRVTPCLRILLHINTYIKLQFTLVVFSLSANVANKEKV